MCGILFSAGLENKDVLAQNSAVVELLDRRGPDSRDYRAFESLKSLPGHALTAPPVQLTFYASVLSLRGEQLVSQPLEDDNSSAVLCWNGEAWQIGDEGVLGNDTLLVQRGLVNAALRNSKTQTQSLASGDHVVTFLASISGPFALVFYDPVAARIYFARDCLGRRSLLVSQDTNTFTLSSVSDGQNGWSEVDADGIYALHWEGDSVGTNVTHRFPHHVDFFKRSGTSISFISWTIYDKIPRFNHCLPLPNAEPLTCASESVLALQKLLVTSISLRLGGITSNCSSIYSSRRACSEEKRAKQTQGGEDTTQQTPLDQPKLAILFSGGLDCSVLARIINDLLPLDHAIDLLNVAFQNPRQQDLQNGVVESVYELCPDRITARRAHAELVKVCPGRLWRLVEINIPFEEAQAHRDMVLSLMYPHDTEMDRSIALALYFASRGKGVAVCTIDGAKESYETPARVLFSGLGADELFGGYQRHATAFVHNGYAGLLDALELDITRLGKRNLGRDDRVISHWGKEARYPYLDESLVHWAVTAPVWDKCGFGQQGDAAQSAGSVEDGKKVLRLLALRLGMPGVACEKKRAIQFGARTAKMEGNSKGTQTISKTQKPGR